MIAVAAIVVLSLLVRWAPPLGPMLYNVDRTPLPGPITLLVTTGQAAVVGVLAFAAAAFLGRRAE